MAKVLNIVALGEDETLDREHPKKFGRSAAAKIINPSVEKVVRHVNLLIGELNTLGPSMRCVEIMDMGLEMSDKALVNEESCQKL